MGKKRVKQRRNVAKQTRKNEETDSSVTENNDVAEANDHEEPTGADAVNVNSKASTLKTATLNENLKLPSPVGLQNLGNTCFFNSVMQNLCHTPALRHVLRHHKKMSDESMTCTVAPSDDDCPPLTYKPAPPGPLTTALLFFLDTANTPVATNNGNKRQNQRARTLSPKALFGQICMKNQRFRGYQQQDSQELLHSLFDSIKAEDTKRKKSGILRALNLEHARARDVDDEMRARVKHYGIEVSHNEPSIVESVFGGNLRSSVLCDECGSVTGVTEPFTDISLPIIDDKRTFHHTRNSPAAKIKNKKLTSVDDVHADDVNSKEEFKKTTQPMSKHARKKAKKEAKRQNRQQKRGQVKGRLEAGDSSDGGGGDAVPVAGTVLVDLASDIAESVLCDVMRSMKLSEEVTEIAEDDRDSSGCDVSRLRGGAFDTSHVPLGNDEPIQDETTNSDRAPNTTDCDDQHPGLKLPTNQNQDYLQCQKTSSPDADGQEVTEGQEVLGHSSESLETVTTPIDHESRNHKIVNNHAEGHVIPTEDQVVENGGGREQPCLTINGERTGCAQVNGDNHDTESCDGERGTDLVNRDHENVASEQNETTDKDDSDNDVDAGDAVFTPCRPLKKTLESLFDTPQHHPVTRNISSSFCDNLPQALAPRYQSKDQECSVQSCLHQFTMAEMLTGANKFGCETCTKRRSEDKKTVYCNASKQMLISKPPPVLVIHLKRFQQNGFSFRKVNKHVRIPTTFDLAPFCSTDCEDCMDGNSQLLYHLYGTVEHCGSLTRGHYTSYVKLREENRVLSDLVINDTKPSSTAGDECRTPPGQWYHISDTIVTRTTEAKALACNAYLLFYERIFPSSIK